MTSLRFLLVHSDERQAARIAAVLSDANHTVLPTIGLEEASDALSMENFDAILMESEFTRRGLTEFSAKLRDAEEARRGSIRVPVIAIDGHPVKESGFDAVMPNPINPHALTAEVARLAKAVCLAYTKEQTAAAAATMAVLEPKKFEEQVGDDPELMVEIIDLFLEERKRQEPEMRTALETLQFDRVSRLAHTIKGSLASLHATRARYHAQELEVAARGGQEESSRAFLAALEADLAELEPELLHLKLEVSLPNIGS